MGPHGQNRSERANSNQLITMVNRETGQRLEKVFDSDVLVHVESCTSRGCWPVAARARWGAGVFCQITVVFKFGRAVSVVYRHAGAMWERLPTGEEQGSYQLRCMRGGASTSIGKPKQLPVHS